MMNSIDQLKVEREISRVPVSPSKIRIPLDEILKTRFILDGRTSKDLKPRCYCDNSIVNHLK